MSKANAAAEPSMEEILASIRRIIADEEVEPKRPAPVEAAPQPVAAPLPAAAPDKIDEEDVLDLAMAQAEASVVPEAKQPDFSPLDDVGFADPLPDPELEEMAPDLMDFEPVRLAAPPPPPPVEPPVIAPPPRLEPAPAADDRLLSRAPEQAVTNAFGSLAQAMFARDARTIEDITKDLLRPMLREWLDDNLPPLVERLVREEIERVARGRR